MNRIRGCGGCDVAALTHGHPSGWLAAGSLALLIRMLVDGRALGEAAEEALTRRKYPGW